MKFNFHNLFMRGSLKPVLQAQLAIQREEALAQTPLFLHAKNEFLCDVGLEMPAQLRTVMELAAEKSRLADPHLALFDNQDAVSFRLVRTANGLPASEGASRRIVSTGREALEKIGYATVREMAAAAAVSKLFQFDGIWQSCSDEEFWLHSVATAIASRRLYNHLVGTPSADMVPFLAGLLHDLGTVAAHRTLGTTTEYRQALLQHLQHRRPLDGEEEALLGFTHADLGAAVLDAWELPPELCGAVRHHHRNRDNGGAVDSQLLHVLRIADDMALRLSGAGHADFMAPNEALLGESLGFLELTTSEWAALMAQVTGEWEMLARLGWFQVLRPPHSAHPKLA